MKKTIITIVLALCVISTVCCAYAAAAESAKTDVVLTIEETTTQFTSARPNAQVTENKSAVSQNDTNVLKTGAVVSYRTITAVFVMLTATVAFFWFYKKKKLSFKE